MSIVSVEELRRRAFRTSALCHYKRIKGNNLAISSLNSPQLSSDFDFFQLKDQAAVSWH